MCTKHKGCGVTCELKAAGDGLAFWPTSQQVQAGLVRRRVEAQRACLADTQARLCLTTRR